VSLWALCIAFLWGAVALASGEPPIYVYFFDAPGCPKCEPIEGFLRETVEPDPQIRLTIVDVHEPAGIELGQALLTVAGVGGGRFPDAPGLLVGDTYLDVGVIGDKTITAAIDKYRVLGAPDVRERAERIRGQARHAAPEMFQRWSVAAILGAGLLDGINPCAFATLVFFLAYLGVTGASRRGMLLVGLSFAAGVFAIYFAFGLGLLHAFLALEAFPVLRQSLYVGIALICLILAALSLQDYRHLRVGDPSKVRLQLPLAAKQRAHQAIRGAMRARVAAPAAFIAGGGVSVLEIACTGQVYIPALIYMSSISQTRLAAIGWLLLYDTLFIAPLLCLLGLSLAGASSRWLALLAEQQAGRTKLLMALFFVICGAFFALRAFGW
jgi:cytochrome c biogenesis protein CcdA/thiol-disulfide isomerase/thioredoxin